MKQVKIEYEKCKAKLPNRPPDEIDFGLGFRAALSIMYSWLDYSAPHEELKDKIEKEL
jgi:hypothetical protein